MCKTVPNIHPSNKSKAAEAANIFEFSIFASSKVKLIQCSMGANFPTKIFSFALVVQRNDCRNGLGKWKGPGTFYIRPWDIFYQALRHFLLDLETFTGLLARRA